MGSEGCRVLVPSGVLGSGCPQSAMDRGIALRPHAIALDAGSTDSGPYYLGTGTSKMTRKAVKRDLGQAMLARDALRVPLIIGSCGTCGADSGVDWVADICAEVAREERLEARVALVYSEQDRNTLERLRAGGRIQPLSPSQPLSSEQLSSCDRVVALMGHEPLAAALEAGADIILAGRTTDTAVLAAAPLLSGFPAGPSWHAAKIAECGGLCSSNSRMGGVLMTIDMEGFEIEPMHGDNACTPQTVSAHMLYENANPYQLKEPGIVLDTSEAEYRSLDARRVRVTGSRATRSPYSLKLEGAGKVGYRTQLFSGIADPKVLASFDRWLAQLRSFLVNGIERVLGFDATNYDIDFRPYGWNALSFAARSSDAGAPLEVGLMVLVTAPTQERATEIAKYCNPYVLHFPLDPADPLPSFAFPFSPAEIEMGALYEFKLNHVLMTDDALEFTRTRWVRAGAE